MKTKTGLFILIFAIILAIPLLADSNPFLVKFKEGDRLPVKLQTEGNLFEITQESTVYITVKHTFWIKFHEEKILASLDGIAFKPVQEVFGGSFQMGANNSESPEGIASAIYLKFNAALR